MIDRPDTDQWPEYCCAILRDGRGRYLLERRPADGRAASGLVTCFGGTRHDGEHPDACIIRELGEELGVVYAPADLALSVSLVDATENIIAWFYSGLAPSSGLIVAETGIEVIWAEPAMLAELPLSPWHAAAIGAEVRGEPIARVTRPLAG